MTQYSKEFHEACAFFSDFIKGREQDEKVPVLELTSPHHISESFRHDPEKLVDAFSTVNRLYYAGNKPAIGIFKGLCIGAIPFALAEQSFSNWLILVPLLALIATSSYERDCAARIEGILRDVITQVYLDKEQKRSEVKRYIVNSPEILGTPNPEFN